MNKLQNPRYIEVNRCGYDECPHCIPHPYNSQINYCDAIGAEVSARVKYFPKKCPLNYNIKKGYQNEQNR